MAFFDLIKRWRPASTPGATPTAVERPSPATSTDAEDDEGVYSGCFTDPDGHVWEVLYDAA